MRIIAGQYRVTSVDVTPKMETQFYTRCLFNAPFGHAGLSQGLILEKRV